MSHPLRELVVPEIERPIDTGDFVPNERYCERFSSNTAAVIVTPDAEYAVACQDLSYGGAKLFVEGETEFAKGLVVTVKLTLGREEYEDSMVVVAMEAVDGNTVLHLSLHEENPATYA